MRPEGPEQHPICALVVNDYLPSLVLAAHDAFVHCGFPLPLT